MLATLAERVPHGDDWLSEVKWDGFWALCYVAGGRAEMLSRNDNDLTKRFPTVAAALPDAVTADVVLDGEVVALDTSGKATFSAAFER